MLYDTGIKTGKEDWLLLHRNENLFIDPLWMKNLLNETLKEINPAVYPSSDNLQLRQAIAHFYNLTEDHVYVNNGADGVLADLLCYLRNKYNTIGLLKVGFQVYSLLAFRYKYTISHYDNHSIAPLKNVLSVIDSPNSITGEKVPYSILKKLDEDEENFLIWDNVYGEYAEDFIQQSLIKKNRVIVRSFSKFFGLANLRIGYCLGDPELIKALLYQKDVFPLSDFTQKIAIKVFEKREVFNNYCKQVLENKKILIQALVSMGFKLTDSQANFLFISHPNYKAKWLCEQLAKYFIAVRYFQNPTLISNYVRMAVPPSKQLIYVLDILRRILKQGD